MRAQAKYQVLRIEIWSDSDGGKEITVLLEGLARKTAALCGEPVLASTQPFEGESSVAPGYDALKLALALRVTDLHLGAGDGIAGDGIYHDAADAKTLRRRRRHGLLRNRRQGQQHGPDVLHPLHNYFPNSTTLTSTLA